MQSVLFTSGPYRQLHARYTFLQSTCIYAIMKGGRFETFQKRRTSEWKKMESSSSYFFFFNPDQCPLLLAFPKAPNSNDLLRGGGGGLG